MAPSPDQKIRSSLAFLRKADRRVIKSSRQLQKLYGDNDPPGVFELLKRHTFHVEGNRYAGRMTQPQADFLAPYESQTLDDFANALATILICLDRAALAALNGLENALNACQPAAPTAKSEIRPYKFIPVPIGCCTYDTQPPREGMSRATCDGLVGDWTEGPCPPDATGGKPTSKSSRKGKNSGS